MTASIRDMTAVVRFAPAPVRLTRAPFPPFPIRVRLIPASVCSALALVRPALAPIRPAGAPVRPTPSCARLVTGPDESGPASVSPSASPDDDAAAPVDDADAPPASGPVSARDADEGAPPSSGTFTRIHAAVFSFAGSRKEKEGRDFIVRVIKEALGPDVSGEIVDEIVQATLAEALECGSLPWFEFKVPAWFARITRRQIAQYFDGGERRDRR